jgi:alkanesulfonate monooxygenase SsuD/methylene tetrahydromethanopterin reductase-like flavin-dependent oxidoreductase (luciferase family)
VLTTGVVATSSSCAPASGASIDRVSGGRLIVGLGAGYLEREFAAMGVPLAERGRRMDEHLDAMRALWTTDAPEFHGRHVDFAGVDAHPRPMAPAGPPIVVGGISDGARRRAIRAANGWYLFNTDVDIAREAVEVIRAELELHERPVELGPLEISMTPVGAFDRSVVEAYAELGVDRLVVLPRADAPSSDRHAPVPADDILRTIDRVAASMP